MSDRFKSISAPESSLSKKAILLTDHEGIYREARDIGFKLGELLDECGQARREVEVFLNQNLGRTDQATGIKAGVTDYFDQLHILDRDMRKAASIRKGG